MRLSAPQQPDRGETIIPMINVVFLLLIFFLMTAQIAPPQPFEVTPPEADADRPAEAPLVVYLGADGAVGFRKMVDEADVLAALTAEILAACDGEACPERPDLMLRADQSVPAQRLAALLPKLAAAGVGRIQIVTTLP